MNIRTVTPADARELLHIYAPYVENTTVTFEYEVPSVEDFAHRIRHTLEKYPYLAAVEGNDILGYAYASAFKDRAAYAWSVETSIYVREDRNHKGIGTALYQALEQVLAKQNICNLCACIAYPNPASIAFHERFGYRTVAHFHASGFKRDAWSDMVWMEKELRPHTVPPEPFIPFPELPHG
ncbi:MAG: GNAT family N-acetyltransferase [Blautia sp.]|nr:GNAT family N-acetyltransferase [Blautia sp.]